MEPATGRIETIMPIVKHGATYEDLVALPDNLVAEIVDGDLHASPRPAMRHSLAAAALSYELGPPFHKGRGGPGGWWILPEPELHFGDDVLVPDLAGWRRERMPEVPDTVWVSLTPDWVCEVASPSTERLDRVHKLRIYARAGVVHAWIVNPLTKTLEVFRRDEAQWTLAGAFGGDEVVRAEPFDAIELELARLWGGPEPRP
jgi:Uma2 family endonuclease